MTWQTITVPRTSLATEVARIQSAGGTIIRCCPEDETCVLTLCWQDRPAQVAPNTWVCRPDRWAQRDSNP